VYKCTTLMPVLRQMAAYGGIGVSISLTKVDRRSSAVIRVIERLISLARKSGQPVRLIGWSVGGAIAGASTTA
jgi:anti-anti-sigma regulatory factor